MSAATERPAEVEALLWLANVTGAASKRQACRWISANVGSLRFQTAIRNGPETPAVKLKLLADLQRGLERPGFAPEDAAPIAARLGEVGGLIEADGRLVAGLVADRADRQPAVGAAAFRRRRRRAPRAGRRPRQGRGDQADARPGDAGGDGRTLRGGRAPARPDEGRLAGR